MQLNEIIKGLDELSMYELNLVLHRAADLLSDETKQEEVRNILRVGMVVTFYHSRFKREARATVVKVNKSRVILQTMEKSHLLEVNLSQINIANIEMATTFSKSGTLRKADLKLGDEVGFIHDGREVYGIIIKLNPKMARIKLNNGETWNVHYTHLFSIVNGGTYEVNAPFAELCRV